MFAGLCGSQSFNNVVVVTTFWDQIINEEEGKRREAQLKSKFFKALVNGGACFMRHNRTMETAREVLNHIFTLTPTNVRIQEEIRIEGKCLPGTEAGAVHTAEMNRLMDKHKKELADLKDRLTAEHAKSKNELDKKVKNLEQKLRDLEKSQETWKKWLEAARMVCTLLSNALQWHMVWMSKR